MKLPVVKKILREDLKGAPPWISAIIEPINSFMESVYQALNHNLTYTENLATFVKEITYTTTASYPMMDNIEFTNELRTKATGLQILQVIEKVDYRPAPGPVYVPWKDENGTIVLSYITGLEASKTYIIRLLIS